MFGEQIEKDLAEETESQERDVVASYEDALAYVDNESRELAEQTLEAMGRSGEEVVTSMIEGRIKTQEIIKTIAFVYGKTDMQVSEDARRKAYEQSI